VNDALLDHKSNSLSRPPRLSLRRAVQACLAGGIALGMSGLGCSSSSPFTSVPYYNTVDTVTLYSLSSGPLREPNAFSVEAGAVETWRVGSDFDFVFLMDSAGRAAFLPLGVLGLPAPRRSSRG